MAKYNKVSGKHILVIGGSRGIGRGVVEAGIESGARLTLVGSSQKSADTAVSSIKTEYPDAQLVGLACDLSKPTIEQDLDALLTEAARLSGEIDHIVYTAADRIPMGPLQGFTSDDLFRASQMRLLAPFMLGKLAQKHLAGAVNGLPGQGKDKSLVFTTGAVASKPAPNSSVVAYFAGGLSGSRNLALELSPIRVNVVEPGAVNTDLWNPLAGDKIEDRNAVLQKMYAHLPVGKAAVVEEVAEAYMYLLRDSNATGETVRTAGGLHLV